MELYIYLVLIGQLLWAFLSLIDKFMISKKFITNPLVFIIFNGIMNIALLLFIPFIDIHKPSLEIVVSAVLFATLYLAGIAAYYKAIEYEDISKVIMLFNLEPVLVLLFSFLFLHEILRLNQFAGFTFLLAAAFVVTFKKTKTGFKMSNALWFMIISGVTAAISYVAAKNVYNLTDFLNAFFWLRVASFAPLILLFIPRLRREFVSTWKSMPRYANGIIASKMIIDFSVFFIVGYAISIASPSLIIALMSATIPLSVLILSSLISIYHPEILEEELTKKAVLVKLAGLALIIAGITMLNI